jgi:hypothetical protein
MVFVENLNNVLADFLWVFERYFPVPFWQHFVLYHLVVVVDLVDRRVFGLGFGNVLLLHGGFIVGDFCNGWLALGYLCVLFGHGEDVEGLWHWDFRLFFFNRLLRMGMHYWAYVWCLVASETTDQQV